jgi:hypothetical protein
MERGSPYHFNCEDKLEGRALQMRYSMISLVLRHKLTFFQLGLLLDFDSGMLNYGLSENIHAD